MMQNFDLKFYWAVFLRRLPYFLVIAVFLGSVGITAAYILPPVYRSTASMLVEPQQIPGEMAATTVPVNPFEQIQIIEQRIMTRTNLLELAERIGLYAGTEMSVGEIITEMRTHIEFIGFEPDPTIRPGTPGATIIGVAFEAPTAQFAAKGANELVNLILQENVRLRTDRATDTLDFFQAEVQRLAGEIERKAEEIAVFKTENVEALPDSLETRRAQQQREQERLLALEREEAALRNQRATVVWVYERTGRASSVGALSDEEEQLKSLQSELIQARAIYAPTAPQIRTLETRVAALEGLVEEQRASRSVPDGEGGAIQTSELDIELVPIDARLEFIAEDKRLIEETLAELGQSVQETPANEMILSGLDRDLANLQRQHDAAVASLGQAQVGERIEVLSKGQRFSLIEAPSEPGSPVRPMRVLIASAGVVGGIGAGIGFVVLLELLNRSIRRPVELTTKLGIQPLATIPYIRTRRELRWKRSIIALVLFLVVAIPLGLLVLNNIYQPTGGPLGTTLEKLGL